jgi:hypothetical protein
MIEILEPEKMILYPHMFWGCVALLHTDFVPIYSQALQLLTAVMDRLAFHDKTTQNVILSSRPTTAAPPTFSGAVPPLKTSPLEAATEASASGGLVNASDLPPVGKKPASGAVNKASSESVSTEASFVSASNQSVRLLRGASSNLGDSDRSLANLAEAMEPEAPPPEAAPAAPPSAVLFEEVQPLLLKGLLSPGSHAAAVAGLSRLTLLPGDAIWGAPERRLPMHITGLLPWLCLHVPSAPAGPPLLTEVQPGSPSLPSDPSPDAGFRGGPGGPASPGAALGGGKGGPDACTIASNIAQACLDKGLPELASAFATYAEGGYTSIEQLVQQVGASRMGGSVELACGWARGTQRGPSSCCRSRFQHTLLQMSGSMSAVFFLLILPTTLPHVIRTELLLSFTLTHSWRLWRGITCAPFSHQVAPPLGAAFFPRHAGPAFVHLLRLLERGPANYQRVVLLLLKALLSLAPADAAQGSAVYSAVSRLVEGPLCHEALAVLEACLVNASQNKALMRASSDGVHNPASLGKASGAHAHHFPSPSRGLQFTSLGEGGSEREQPLVSSGPGAAEALPSREEALHNTTLALELVLKAYGPNRRRDERRLIPFVTAGGVAPGSPAGRSPRWT